MEQILTPEQRREINEQRDAAEAAKPKPMGIQYEKDANAKKEKKQKLSVAFNKRRSTMYAEKK